MIRMIRSTVNTSTARAGKILRMNVSGRIGETIDDREVFQQFGFQSCPPEGSESIILADGSVYIHVATDDRRYRISLQGGEAAINNDQGDMVHIKNSGEIEVKASSKCIVNAPLVEVGNGTLEAVLNGETFAQLYNTHTQTGGFVVPVAPPTVQALPGIHLSLKVKAAK
jgi:phage gp45-like